jgi:hypothetical protein
MSSLANIPSEYRCKQILYKIITDQDTCCVCNGKINWKREYGWCKVCRKKIRPKATTWFNDSKLTYRQTFCLISAWQQRQSPGSVKLATGISYTTIQRWYKRFRLQIPHEPNNSKLFGIVEVDEAYFGKRKFGNQTIVIGAIQRNTRELRLKIIPDTEQDSLEIFIADNIERGSLVVTDCHAGYNDIEWLGYGSERWNHSKGNFAGTNHIEQNWSAMKRHMRKLYGNIPTNELQLIMDEWEARHNRPELFESPEQFLGITLVPL